MAYNPIEDDLKFETIRDQIVEELGEDHFEKDKGYWIKYFKTALKLNKEQLLVDIVFRWRKELREAERNENRNSIFNPAGYLHNLISKEINIKETTVDIARIDNNLIDYPFYRQGKRTNEPIYYSREQTNKLTNSIIKSEWTIESNSLIPNDQDADVFKALMKIFHDAGMPSDNTVYFSKYELCKLLNLPDDGRNYTMINNAIQYLFDLKIGSKDAYMKFGDKIFMGSSAQSVEMRLFSKKQIIGEDTDNDKSLELFKNFVVLNPDIANNMRLYYSSTLNWEFYIALRFSVSKRIYEILQKERNKTKKLTYQFLLLSFAQQIGMSIRVTRNIKHNIKNALDELYTAGYIKQFDITTKNKLEYISFNLARS